MSSRKPRRSKAAPAPDRLVRVPASPTDNTSSEWSSWQESVPAGLAADGFRRVKVGSETVYLRYVTSAPSPAESGAASTKPAAASASNPETSVTEVSSGGERIRGEVEPLAPAGNLQMLIRRRGDSFQGVLMEGAVVVEHQAEVSGHRSLVGNIYLGVVTAVVPSLEAAFVDIGTGPHGILRPPGGFDSLSAGDRILVRVTKDSFGSKGPKLRADLSLTGRYLVLLPGSEKIAVSRHLSKSQRAEMRARVGGLLEQVVSDGDSSTEFGVIARSAATTAPDSDLVADLKTLLATWRKVASVVPSEGPAPRLVLAEPSLPIRFVREHFTSEYKRLITNDPEVFEEVCDYLRSAAPDLVSLVQLDDSGVDLFSRFHVFDQLRRATERKVFLPSGGYLVIDETEALTAIDVNTGRFAGDEAYADVILRNNLEAAVEAAHQIRLRDIGGIIVIDFIDMADPDHRDQVLERFRAALARDRTTSDVLTISDLGLVEMSRKRRTSPLLDLFSSKCGHCSGRGILVDLESELLTPVSDEGPATKAA